MSASDKSTIIAHPGIRVFYNIATFIILGITMAEGNSLFVGLIMLSTGLIFDYLKFTPKAKFRKITTSIGLAVSFVILLFNMCATFGAMTVTNSPSTTDLTIKIVSFPFFKDTVFEAKWYWLACGITILCTVLDWMSEGKEKADKKQSSGSLSQPIEG